MVFLAVLAGLGLTVSIVIGIVVGVNIARVAASVAPTPAASCLSQGGYDASC